MCYANCSVLSVPNLYYPCEITIMVWFYRWGDWGTEGSSNLFKVISQLVEPGLEPRFVLFKDLCSSLQQRNFSPGWISPSQKILPRKGLRRNLCRWEKEACTWWVTGAAESDLAREDVGSDYEKTKKRSLKKQTLPSLELPPPGARVNYRALHARGRNGVLQSINLNTNSSWKEEPGGSLWMLPFYKDWEGYFESIGLCTLSWNTHT